MKDVALFLAGLAAILAGCLYAFRESFGPTFHSEWSERNFGDQPNVPGR